MKLEDYIQHLQYLRSKCGDIDVMVHTTYEQSYSLDLEEKYTYADKPYYDEGNNCIVIHYEFKRYD